VAELLAVEEVLTELLAEAVVVDFLEVLEAAWMEDVPSLDWDQASQEAGSLAEEEVLLELLVDTLDQASHEDAPSVLLEVMALTDVLEVPSVLVLVILPDVLLV